MLFIYHLVKCTEWMLGCWDMLYSSKDAHISILAIINADHTTGKLNEK